MTTNIPPPPRVRTPTRSRTERVLGLILNVAAIAGVLCVAAALIFWLLGARVIIFSSGSMAPNIPTGSIAVTAPIPTDDVRIGDVITVQRPGDQKLVTHRVVALRFVEEGAHATLRGDANTVDDAVAYSLGSTTQRVLWSAPGAGRVVAVAQSPWLLFAVLTVLVIIAIPTKRKRATSEAVTDQAVSNRTARFYL